MARLRSTMTKYAGVVRNASGLADAIKSLREIERSAAADGVLANMALAARFIAGSALLREESRGAHERSDFPKTRQALASRSFLTLAELDRLDAPDAMAELAVPPRAGGCR
jgi:L-aspartate oxidase